MISEDYNVEYSIEVSKMMYRSCLIGVEDKVKFGKKKNLNKLLATVDEAFSNGM